MKTRSEPPGFRLTRPFSFLLIFAMLGVACLSLATGSAPVPVIAGLVDWFMGAKTAAALVMGEIRLPRTLLALGVGAALGLSGAALQGLLRNPLADPSLIGASQGAALGAAIVFYSGLSLPFLPMAAGEVSTALAGLLGAGAALFLMLALSGAARPALIIMGGLAMSSLLGAALALALNFAPNPFAMQELVFWLLGSVAERSLKHCAILLPALILGAFLIGRQRRLLAALSLGEAVAESMGCSPRRGNRMVVLGVAILVGASVSVAGNIGFVGLVVPHLVRPWVGHRPDRLLLPSALAGATLVCLADIGVRWAGFFLPAEREIKLGVLTALIGAPFFIHLIFRERRQWR
ncbi:MAG: iron ABC transporter permease [Zoogloeaceae bacterium]|nr:iron ABC transporter permease [Zoogloeaceae bacterium]